MLRISCFLTAAGQTIRHDNLPSPRPPAQATAMARSRSPPPPRMKCPCPDHGRPSHLCPQPPPSRRFLAVGLTSATFRLPLSTSTSHFPGSLQTCFGLSHSKNNYLFPCLHFLVPVFLHPEPDEHDLCFLTSQCLLSLLRPTRSLAKSSGCRPILILLEPYCTWY